MSLDEEDIWHTYAMDGAEALRDIEESLLSLEADPTNAPEINRLYRALHTLKGNSALLGLERIENLAHASEDMVGLVRDRGVAMDRTMVDLMLALTDRLGQIVERVGRERRDAEPGQVDDLVVSVRAWLEEHTPEGLVVEAQAVLRGQIVVWSDPPPAPNFVRASQPEALEDDVALEIFLGLCRETLPQLIILAEHVAQGANGDARADLARAADDLAETARRAGHDEAAVCLATLFAAAGDVACGGREISALAADSAGALSRVEAAYRAGSRTPQDFGLVQEYRRTCAALVLGDVSLLRARLRGESAPQGAQLKLLFHRLWQATEHFSLRGPAREMLGQDSELLSDLLAFRVPGASAFSNAELLAEQLESSARAVDGVADWTEKTAPKSQRPGTTPRSVSGTRAPGVASSAVSRPEGRASMVGSRAEVRASTAHPASEDGASKAEFLRIDARKISLIMDLAGEIALASGAVTHHPELEGKELEGFSAASHKLEVLIRELQNEVSAMRLVPVAGVFQRMKRVVRDTAKRTEKKVELVLVGENTEIDKVMVDCLHDPLVHLLRNAIDHGLETPAERIAQGKPEVGRIVLEASHQGGEVSVQVSDDGRGMNRKRILARAHERGLIAEGETLTDDQALSLVFLPGFSTKETIDELSGRGVGMDVIRTTIEGLRGRVQLESVEGKGSSLNMTVPLTLAFVEAMVVRERDRLFALPIEKVFEVFKAEPAQLSTNSADGQTVIRVRDGLIPVLWLHRYYGEPDNDNDTKLAGRVIVVVQTARGNLALPVDTLLGNQPVMLKPLRGLLANVRAAAGCGMLRSGDVALALDCERLHA
jgi:two-component system chemotaxis sensor kinase CheA